MKTVRTYFEYAEFLDFLIHLMTLETILDEPEFEPDGYLIRRYRQPEIRPVGIRLE
ncbi:MAG TPA: hypothetical protein VF596_10085 [Pyrinomonadaceae bacterium]|jgi:hypothetical protein